jgi:hypothetical protein
LRKKGLIFTTIIFFLLVNTTYYWEGKLGLFAVPAFILLAVVYFGLVIALLQQLYFLFKERFNKKYRLALIGILTAVLSLTYLKPLGLVDFDKFEGEDVLVAEREGSANCLTTLKLKDNYTFRERIGCFGVSEIKGTYRMAGDTIYFDNIRPGGSEEEFYKFAIIKTNSSGNPKILGDLIRYKDLTDTVGQFLWITKKESGNLKDKKPNR